MASPSDELQGRSSYEQKMGKAISVCSKCQGEGRVRAPLSKKARARRKRMQQQEGGGDASSTNKHDPPQMKACPACDGSGLIATAPSESDTGQPVSAVHPGVSVAIVGGGIGGIALAAALQHRRIPCVVYERDASFEERKQGYGLTMQQGARALRSLGFFSFSDGEELVAGDASGNEAEATEPQKTRFGIHSKRHVVHTPDGTVVGEWGMKVWGGRFEKNGRQHAKRQNAHISRQGLRKLLMEMLLPGTVKWGHQFVGYSDSSVGSEDGSETPRLSLTFRRRLPEFRGAEEECEEEVSASATILVGCDGIRSAVRATKLGANASPLRYLGCIVVLGIAASPASELSNGETVFQTADGTTRLYAMPFARPGGEASTIDGVTNKDGSDRGLSMWQLSFPMDESDAKKLSQRGPSALKAEALRRCGEWHSPIPELLSQTPEDLVTGYPCYDRALVEKEVLREGCAASNEANPFVTILGDACHPMSPFKGQGANQALLDAVLLARKLYSTLRTDRKRPEAGENTTLDRIPLALAQFEEEMLQRSAVKVKKSADAAKFLHTDQAIAAGNVTRGAAG